MPPCLLCNDLEKISLDRVRLALDFTYSDLLWSVRTRACMPCSFILEAIERSVSTPEDVSRVYVYGLAAEGDTLTVQIYFKDDRPKIVLEVFHPDVGSGSTKGRWRAIKAKPLTKGHPLGDESLAWVKGLLKNCQRNHGSRSSTNRDTTGCGVQNSTVLPQRILRLDQQRFYKKISVRLQENDLPVEASYATLSHCWGLHQNCVTTTANIDERSKNIPWIEIPRTFQESIQYCLKLGISYIWIDALCIIQDDVDDWQRESAKMADIFQSSFLTLAATATPSDTTGCFAQELRNVYPENITLKSSPRGLPGIMVRRARQHWTLPPTPASKQYYPLLSRGWVFQEILLSPRIIHFGRQELIWECACQTQCECGEPITGLKKTALLWTTLNITEEIIGTQEEVPESTEYSMQNMEAQTISQASQQWQSIVQEYSALNLTKASDRLPALSGLAKRSASLLGSYHAGLWSSTLRHDLMWRVDKLEPHSTDLSTYRAPSWSWASVRSPVRYWKLTELERPGHLERMERLGRLRSLERLDRAGADVGAQSGSSDLTEMSLQVLKCEVLVAGENPFGEVQSGVLRLKGHLARATVHYVSHRIGDWGENVRFEHDPLRYELHKYHHRVGSVELPFFADYILSDKGPGHVEDKGEVSIFQILVNLFLVLRRTDQSRDLNFRRIGLFRAPPAYDEIYGLNLMREGFSYYEPNSLVEITII